MEVLDTNYETVPIIDPIWDQWMVFDHHPRIATRGVDFTESAVTVKRKLVEESARRGLDAVAKVLHGDRILFQVFSPDGQVPSLHHHDARIKYPWSQWFNGKTHFVSIETENEKRNLRAHIYKQASRRLLKARVTFVDGGLSIQAMSADSLKYYESQMN